MDPKPPPAAASVTARGIELPAGAGRPLDAVATARRLLREARFGSLATLDPAAGHPFVSLVEIANDSDGTPVFIASHLSLHTRNIAADPRVSLLVVEPGTGDPLTFARLTLSGTARRDDEPRLRRRFLARHPKAALYAALPGFAFWRLDPSGLHLNGGPGRAADQPGPAELLTGLEGAEELVAGEEGVLAHMNADHAEAVRLYATRLAGRAEGAWRMAGIDPEGMDLACGDTLLRLPFPRRVTTPGEAAKLLRELAAEARARG